MTQYEKDKDRYFNFNSSRMSFAYYNLVISIRDVGLWINNLRPHRNWRLKHVKEYFGIKGSAEKVLNELNKLKDEA